MADTLYRTAGDTGPSMTFDLEIDNVGYSLTGQTVVAYMVNLSGTLVNTVTTVTNAADQVATPGRCTTSFTGAQLVKGTYTLEWYATPADLTFPADKRARPILIVREAEA